MSTDSIESGLSSARVDRLSDDELLTSTRQLVGRSNQLLAALLVHLAEVETRGLHRSKACSSLYTYCIYELRFSEDAASRRVCAARLVKRFPALLAAVANGELHLTGLLMLGPYVTSQNQCEVLARAKFRTKKELAKLVRILDPLPDVPAQIVALGPASAPVAPKARLNWQSFADSLCPVRELAPGDRPREWANDLLSGVDSHTAPRAPGTSLCIETVAPAREALANLETAVRARETSLEGEPDRAAMAREALANLETAVRAGQTSLEGEPDGAALARETSPRFEFERAALAREALPNLETAVRARDTSLEGEPDRAAMARETSPRFESERAALAREALANLQTVTLAREASPRFESERAALAREALANLETAVRAGQTSLEGEPDGAATARETSPRFEFERAALARETSPRFESERAAMARQALANLETAALARETSPGFECDRTAMTRPTSLGGEPDRAAMAREVLANLEAAALARETSLGLECDRSALAREASPTFESERAALAPLAGGELPGALDAPQRYRVQFTASEEYVQLIERAKALSSGAGNGTGLAEIHLRALRVLVAEMERRKYGAARSRQREEKVGSVDDGRSQATERWSPQLEGRARYVPVAVRRAVFERDGARCNYVDARGQRCRESSGLELHHLVPFARGGAHVCANLALFCRAHNSLAAEEDFGRRLVEAEREKVAHESWSAQKET